MSSSSLLLRQLTIEVFLLFCVRSVHPKKIYENHIIISYDDRIEIINGSSSRVTESFSLSPTVNYIVGVTTDGSDEFMFLSDVKDQRTTIFRVSLDTAHQINPIVEKNSLGLVEGVAFDPKDRVLYFSDSNRISKSRIEQQRQTPEDVVVFEDEDKPRGVAVDSCERILYWVTWNRKNHRIERSNLDGSGRRSIVTKGLDRPHSLVLDPWSRRLYWIDVNSSNEFKIERSATDGSNRTVICQGSGNAPFAITVSRQHVYWSDWRNMIVWRVPKQGGNCTPQAIKRLSASRPMGIATLSTPESCEFVFVPEPDPILNAKLNIDGKTEKEEEENEVSDSSNKCLNYCLHGKCLLTTIGIPMCSCDHGFSGSRCQNDLCHNYCLNGGICRWSPMSQRPVCQCQSNFNGSRCHLESISIDSIYVSATAAEKAILYGLIVTSSSTVVLIAVFIILGLKFYYYRSKNHEEPEWIRAKRSRVYSTTRERRLELTKCCDNDDTDDDDDHRRESSEVKVELEDCCHMTLCDTPCVEAKFRKARRRGHEENNDKNVLLENDSLDNNNKHSSSNELF